MTNTFATSGAVAIKAGVNANVSLTVAQWDQIINQAEAFINILTRTDYVATYSGLDDERKLLIENATAAHAATTVIARDMSGFTSRAEAQTMLDVNWAQFSEDIKLLKEKDNQAFISGT